MKSETKNQDSSMVPLIVIVAFIILMTIVLISFRRIREENKILLLADTDAIHLSLDTRKKPNFFESALNQYTLVDFQSFDKAPAIYENILSARRLIASEQYPEAENILRTLYFFYPNDLEVVALLSRVLKLTGHQDEAKYFRDRLAFLQSPVMTVDYDRRKSRERRR